MYRIKNYVKNEGGFLNNRKKPQVVECKHKLIHDKFI